MTKIISKAINKGLSILEYYFSINWFNPFATLYVNFRSLPFKKAVCLPIWMYGRPRLMSLFGKIDIKAPLKSGMIRFNYVNIGSPSNMGVQSEINNKGTIVFHGSAKIRTGNRIVVGFGASLEIGDKLIMGDNINIGCMESIKIGSNTRIAHRSQIFDSNYHYVANLSKKIVNPLSKPIVIGKGCWICNSSTVNSGAVIPDYCILASNGVINKDWAGCEHGTMFAGAPAKPIAAGVRLVNNINKEHEITSYHKTHNNSPYLITKDIDEKEWFEQQ